MGLAKTKPPETTICEYCQKEFVIRKNTYEREGRRFCSLDCHWKAYGIIKTQRALDEFWTHIHRCDHDWVCLYCCWPWTATTTTTGYGKWFYQGKTIPPHRKAWELHQGRIMPKKLFAAHWCHNPICCNPLHIHPATPKQNTADSVRDGMHLFGSRSGMSKLVETDIPEIFRLHAMGWTHIALGKKYNVHSSTIQNVLRRNTWTHVHIDPAFFLRIGRGKIIHPDSLQVREAYNLWIRYKNAETVCSMLDISQATFYRYRKLLEQTSIKTPSHTIILSKAPHRRIDRKAIYQRDQGKCHICHKKVSDKRFTIDHLIPRIYGGSDAPSNLALAHPTCNNKRQDGLIAAQLRLF